MANELVAIANGIIVEPGFHPPAEVNNFLGFPYDNEDEYEYDDEDWIWGDFVEVIDDPAYLIESVEDEIIEVIDAPDNYALFPVHVCDPSREGYTTALTIEQVDEAEGTLSINAGVIDDYGFVVAGSDMSDLMQDVMGYSDGYAVVRINTSNFITAQFTVTLNINYGRIEAISEVLLRNFCVDSRMLFEARADYKNRLVLTGPMCAIKYVADISGAKIVNSRIISIYTVPMNNCVMVKYADGSPQFCEPCLDLKNVIEIEKGVPGLERVYFNLMGEYSVHHRLGIALSVCTKFYNVYQAGDEVYLPIYDENKKEQFIFPLYKTLAMCYFGHSKRGTLWKTMQAMTVLQGIELPAAAYVCPVEFLKGINYENILSYMESLFKVNRPLENDKEVFHAIKKCKKLSDLVQLFLSLPKAQQSYPVSTIGLFASSSASNSMLMQIAGCTDNQLNEQLVQELVQVLYEVKPKALAAVLTAHRSDLNKTQKAMAVQTIKKYLGKDDGSSGVATAEDKINKKLN